MLHVKPTVSARLESWPMISPVRISGHVFSAFEPAVVTLEAAGAAGRGEAAGVYYKGLTPAMIVAEIEAATPRIEAGVSRETLGALDLSSGARNALDAALWELESLTTGKPVWALAGLEPPRPLLTTLTLGADDPQVMARAASVGLYAQAAALKLKLTGEEIDLERVAAVRAARPDAWIGVDANQGFSAAFLERAIPHFIAARVSLIEQPLRVGREAELDGLRSPIPIAADESVQGLDDIPGLIGRFDVVNIKLDKCGGLTEALAMARLARRLGMTVMVGNMFGTSLAMAPAFVVGQLCDVVDLDGPLALAADREPGVVYAEGRIRCRESVWGTCVA